MIKINEDEMDGTCSAWGRWKIVYRILVGKSERMRSLGRPRSIWEDNIKMDDFREIGFEDVDWFHLA
jgi:hypothetical protein